MFYLVYFDKDALRNLVTAASRSFKLGVNDLNSESYKDY